MERQERALNMSKNTKQVKVMVVSRGVIILSSIWGGGGGRKGEGLIRVQQV